MSERKTEQKVKEVGVDNDCLCIELLSGLRLMGPLRTNPVHREPPAGLDTHTMPGSDFTHSILAT